MTQRFSRLAALASLSFLLLAPAFAQDQDEEREFDADAPKSLSPAQARRRTRVDPLALNSEVADMRWLARRVAAGTTDARILRAYWRMWDELFPFDHVPPRDTRLKALAAKSALEGCQRANAVPLATGFWTNLGPTNIPGRMTSVVFHPTDPNTIYAAGADGGVWKTSDLGQNWFPLTDDQPVLAMGALEIDPVDPNILYAGTGEGNYSGDALGGVGVLKSTDAGASWTLHAIPSAAFHELKVDPNNHTTVYAATRNGLFVSADSGVNWTAPGGGLPLFDTTTVLPSRKAGSRVVLAGVGGSFAGPTDPSGFYRSTDGGATWALIPGMPTMGDTGRIIYAQSRSNPDRIYVAMHETSTDTVKTIYRSDDEGATFTAVGRPGTACGGQCWYNLSFTVDAGNPDILYIGQVSIYRSLDAGQNWVRIGNTSATDYIHVDHHWCTSPAPDQLLATSDGGLYLSTDRGANFNFIGLKLETAQYYHMTTHPADDNLAIAGAQDNGSQRFRGSSAFDQVLGADGAWTAIDWVDPKVWYASTQFLGMARSPDNGNAFVGIGNGIDPNGTDSFPFIAPFALDRGNPSTVFAGTDHLYKSTDQGDNFTLISPLLPVTPGRVVRSMDNCRDQPNSIWVGTTDGRVWNTPDGGTNWNDVTGNLPARSITSIAVHPSTLGTAYVTLGGTGTGHVWKTTDTGATWTDMSAGLPDIYHRHIMMIAEQPNTLIVAADLGVFRTDDGGQTWAVYGTDLPNVANDWLSYSPATGTIRVATHGRGMWQLVPPNTCPLIPDFNGLTAVTIADVGGGTCKPELTWQAATSNCPFAPGIKYNVYRSTDPLFTPGPATLLASGLTASPYRDLTAANNLPYYYIVRAEDGQTGFPGPSNGGKEDINQQMLFVENGNPLATGTFNDDGGDTSAWMRSDYWSVDDLANTTGGGRFAYRSARRRAATYNPDTCGTLTTPDMVLGTGATLTYQASYNIEYQWDGVVVEVSTDAGANWTDVPPSGGYPSDVSQTQGNGCNFPPTRLVFNGPTDNSAPVPFAQYTHDLSAFAGQTARIRWQFSSDPGAEFEGFILDDIRVTPISKPAGGVCAGCAAGAPGVVPNRLFVVPRNGVTPEFIWTSFSPTGKWNLHATASKSAIPTLFSDGASVVAGGLTSKLIDDSGTFPGGFYQVYGADACTGSSVP